MFELSFVIVQISCHLSWRLLCEILKNTKKKKIILLKRGNICFLKKEISELKDELSHQFGEAQRNLHECWYSS